MNIRVYTIIFILRVYSPRLGSADPVLLSSRTTDVLDIGERLWYRTR